MIKPSASHRMIGLTQNDNKTHLSPETLHLHKLHPQLSAILPRPWNNRQGTSVWYIRKLACYLQSNRLHVLLDELEDGLYRRSFPSEGTCNRHFVNYTKILEKKIQKQEVVYYEAAKPPHAGSAVCLAMRDIWSNWGSNWSVSVRG